LILDTTTKAKMSIQPLSPAVIAQIKSSITITHLNSVVTELLKNSLDAHSKKIDINVDYARGGCVVEDDGLGILPSEFGESGGLGKLYRKKSSLGPGEDETDTW
jgi:DNA mismatch repair protein MLH3